MSVLHLQATPRVTTTDQAYNAILTAILDGSIPAGAALPLQELAKSLGMSMMPVREAIRQLEATGIIEMVRHKGARVRPVSDADLEDTYTARIELEGVLVDLAARRFDAADAVKARAFLDEQQVAIANGDAVAARMAHQNFHFSIYESAGSEWLCRSVWPTWHNSERYRSLGMSDPKTVSSRRAEHEAILQACIDHDPVRSRAALREHLMTTVKQLNPAVAERLAGLGQGTP
ncbi:GntR family transcriptional regulator [Paenarthrobacter sp. NPDC058040]|uniref:GntR family transcriptional regulator n=1 Tax=unclassified Paenarthrobacter TaxID=2634190 RepID=UPI0036D99535